MTKVFLTGCALSLVGAVCALGDVLTYNYDTIYAGLPDHPANSAPWFRATFTDIDSTHVRLTLDAVNVSSSEFATTWAFNIDPAIDPSSISFAVASVSNYGGNTTPTVGTDGTGAGPAHGFDIDMSLTPSAKFGQGSQLVYTLSRTSGLDAADFLFTNSSGSTTDLYSALHIQGLSDGNSVWVDPSTASLTTTPVPEASTVAVPVFAAFVVGYSVWRRKAIRAL